jgi:hypothetical protein
METISPWDYQKKTIYLYIEATQTEKCIKSQPNLNRNSGRIHRNENILYVVF